MCKGILRGKFMCAPNLCVCVLISRLVRGRTRAQLRENIGANPAHWSRVEGHIHVTCLVSIVYRGLLVEQ